MDVFWLQAVGLGMMFQGGLILWVGGFPLSLRGKLPRIDKDSLESFAIFWIEQYRLIGLGLTLLGLGFVFLAVLR